LNGVVLTECHYRYDSLIYFLFKKEAHSRVFLLYCRYNEVRKPNNGNDCEINPDDEEYQSQVENAKNY